MFNFYYILFSKICREKKKSLVEIRKLKYEIMFGFFFY